MYGQLQISMHACNHGKGRRPRETGSAILWEMALLEICWDTRACISGIFSVESMGSCQGSVQTKEQGFTNSPYAVLLSYVVVG